MKTLLLVAICLLVTPLIKVKLTEPETYADFWPNGKPRAVRETVRDLDGELVSHGIYRTFYEAGGRESEGRYEDGEREGPWQWWYPSGQRQGECDYEAGVGEFTAYFPNGKVLRKGVYHDLRREGLWTEWYESGHKRMEGPYRGDQQHGRWRYWADGEAAPQLTVEWVHGQRQ